MTDQLLQLLDHASPDPNLIGYLPRTWCRSCSDSPDKVCGKHNKTKCSKCGNYITDAHIDLDYLGHAETTRILLEADPTWTWEPIAYDDSGNPALVRDTSGNPLGIWIRLTVHDHSRLGFGELPASKGADGFKEAIGDALRNAAMRFGIALDLWSKVERQPNDAPQTTTDWHGSLRELLSKVPWPDEFDQDTQDLYQAAGISRMTKGDKNTVSDLSVEQAQFIASKLKTSTQRKRFVEYATEAVEGSEGDGERKSSSSSSDTPPEPSDSDRLWTDVQAVWRKLGIQGPRVLTHARMIVGQDDLDDSEGRVEWSDPRDLGPDAHPDVLRGLLSWLEDQQAKAGAA